MSVGAEDAEVWQAESLRVVVLRAGDEGDLVTVVVDGRLDRSGAERFRSCVMEALGRRPAMLAVDASALTFEAVHLLAQPSERVDHSRSSEDDPLGLARALEPPIQALDDDEVADGIAYMQGLAHWCSTEGDSTDFTTAGGRLTVLRG